MLCTDLTGILLVTCSKCCACCDTVSSALQASAGANASCAHLWSCDYVCIGNNVQHYIPCFILNPRTNTCIEPFPMSRRRHSGRPSCRPLPPPAPAVKPTPNQKAGRAQRPAACPAAFSLRAPPPPACAPSTGSRSRCCGRRWPSCRRRTRRCGGAKGVAGCLAWRHGNHGCGYAVTSVRCYASG